MWRIAGLSLVVLALAGPSTALAAKPAPPPPSTTVVVVTNGDSGPGSLRQALVDVPDGGTVAFAPGLSGTIYLSSGTIRIDSKSLSIQGPGAKVLAIDGSPQGNGANGCFFFGGGATVAISGLTIRNCSRDFFGGSGGAIYSDAKATIKDSVFSGNSVAGSFAGAIYNGGTMTIAGSTVSGNSNSSFALGADGGGIYNNRGTLSVINSTLSGNVDYYFNGSAIYNNGGTLTITNSTLAGNTSGTRGAVYNSGGAVTVTNTILASNAGGNCAGDGLIDGGHNLEFTPSPGTNTCGFTAFAVSGDPLLGALRDNGGPTPTMALPTASPAIDAGDDSVCSASDGPAGKDQRGATRGADGNGDGVGGCDIGAFELNDADLAVEVSGPSTVASGSTMTYTITLSNLGPLGDPAVTLSDTLPQGTNFLSYTATQGTCTPPGTKSATVNCAIGQIESGTNRTATITIKVAASTSGTLQNIARVSGSRFDPNGSNNAVVSITHAGK